MASQAFQRKRKRKHNIFSQTTDTSGIECGSHEAVALATTMDNIETKMSLGQQCASEKGLKKFGD